MLMLKHVMPRKTCFFRHVKTCLKRVLTCLFSPGYCPTGKGLARYEASVRYRCNNATRSHPSSTVMKPDCASDVVTADVYFILPSI